MRTHRIPIVVAALLFSGCRSYSYRSPEGSELSIQIPALSNANLGKVRAGRKMADGSEVFIEVENYSNEEHMTQLLGQVVESAMKGATP